jgi:hypothetical protein
VLLIASQGEEAVISLAHKRYSQNEAGQTVMDGPVTSSPALSKHPAAAAPESDAAFLGSLPLAAQPRIHLCALYEGWIDCVEALQAAQFSGRFVLAATEEAAADRRAALVEYERIQREIASLRGRAEKETQISRRVEFNLDIRRLECELAKATQNL